MALTGAFASQDRSEVVLRGGTFTLPFGPIEVAFDPASLRAGDRELYRFTPTEELEVHGLAMRYRWPGLGLPLAAATRPIDPARPGRDLVAPRLQVPATAFLRIPGIRRALVEGRPLAATLELHLASDGEAVSIAGEPVPLEMDPSAALALTFTDVPIVRLELLAFLGRLAGVTRPPLVSVTPYRPGLVPVVFVHGTQSSVVRWAEMYNRLQGDPEIRRRFQFWFFQYDSGQPVALSALQLREALTAAVARLDPGGTDSALRRMVLIGHSQGGLLVKMQAIHTGDRLWSAVSRKPLEALELSDETRDLLRRGLFVEPLPEVSRVVFIAATWARSSSIAGKLAPKEPLIWQDPIPPLNHPVIDDNGRRSVEGEDPGHRLVASRSLPPQPGRQRRRSAASRQARRRERRPHSSRAAKGLGGQQSARAGESPSDPRAIQTDFNGPRPAQEGLARGSARPRRQRRGREGRARPAASP